MSTRMLIDARHREETRVAIVKGNRIEEFDFESEEHKQLKGNIYLAKVTRVEPSLQAAFIDYGGNRHGFLAFSEIHPDYYQIPKEDREALLREEAEQAAAEEAARNDDGDEDEADYGDGDDIESADEASAPADLSDDGDEDEDAPAPKPQAANGHDDNPAESLRQRRMNLRRRYKIQDVIRRRQVLLVQVVKEERGNKGAALTTYLSLAGRYCVLMPNTSHGGGISRKISNAGDRKRLKSILAELNLPKTMGCIVRTAGLQRSRDEIRRDFDYLARLWDEIRERTLSSDAPAEIHRDSDLVKRAIRDLYNKDIDEVLVEGEDGYRAARSIMKLLMPTAARRVQPYADAVPLFQRYGVEDQLAAMYQPVVQLKSGGYIVINPTEALVSIDINSGRSTREHNVEQTALSTNLEAAAEIARQLRLRDMAGLIVIDFIDMEHGSNNRKVEKAIKEALRHDRARIQVGRISGFGLFEMSRQRLRTGVLEASTRICPHCDGTGFIRTASSAGLQAIRLLEEEAARGRGSRLSMRASQEATLYVLNRKRAELADIEERYGVLIEILTDGSADGARMSVEASGPPPSHAPRLPAPVIAEPDDDLPEEVEDDLPEAVAGSEAETGEDGDGRRKRRRRRRRGGRREDGDILDGSADQPEGEVDEATEADTAEPVAEESEMAEGDAPEAGADAEAGEERRRGRRGRRGGRRRRGEATPGEPEGDTDASLDAVSAVPADEPAAIESEAAPIEADVVAVAAPEADLPLLEPEAAPKPRRRPRARKADAAAEPAASEVAQPVAEPVAVEPAELTAEATPDLPLPVEEAPRPRGRRKAVTEDGAPKPRSRRRKAAGEEAAPADVQAASGAVEPAEPVDPAAPAIELPLAEPAGTVDRDEERAAEANLQGASAALAELPDAPANEGAAEATGEDPSADASAPPRRGWWQRTFGN